jgi:hypothetical protein
LIEDDMAQGSGDGGEENPHSDPERQKYFVGRLTAGAPIFCAGMDEEPECGDGGVDDAESPGEDAEE